jgi:phosphatidylserine/phosphatidylglycerophosphate/cardiolipin synthase-like enzyme
MKAIKTVFASLFAISMIGCSANTQMMNPAALGARPVNTMAAGNLRAQAAATPTAKTNLPFFAMFNNAYRGLLSENEAIGRKDPNNVDKYFVGLIDSAVKTIDGAFYDIDDAASVQALIRATTRGVRVRLVTETDSLMDKHNPTQPRASIAQLRAAGIEIRDDKQAGLMHNKFMVVDNATVWTGSLNLTTSSVYHHNNNSVMIKSPQLAANFNAEFSRLFEQNIFTPNDHAVPNPVVNVSGIQIQTFFSPGGNAMTAIHEELKRATKSIKFMAFSMTDKEILRIMLEKKAAGVKVEGVFDNCLIPQYSIFFDLKKAGVLALGDGNQALMHHKVIIIDDTTVITGSYNFSKSAQTKNQENMLVIKSPLIGKQYADEYFKIRTAAFDNKNLPAYDHPACNKRTPANPAAPAARGTLPGAMLPGTLIQGALFAGEADERE